MNKLLTTVLSLIFLAGCDYQPSGEETQHQNQENAVNQAVNSVGFPHVTNYSRMKEMKHIIESVDQNISTWTYTYSQQTGKFHLLCPSIGYPLPGATQYTNPEQVTYLGTGPGYNHLPQADPDGLYAPASENATWVVCIPPGKTAAQTHIDSTPAVYVEPDVTAFPYQLPSNMLGN